MISLMLKEELCFLHCTRKGLGYEPDPQMASSQFEPVPGTLCQTQCWRNSKQRKNVELYGLDRVIQPGNDWNVDLEDFVSGSFKHWQDHRFDQEDENLFPTVGEILTLQVTSSSGSFLPVCYSELMPPAKMSKVVGDPPCLCGDDRGNETQLFYQEAGFARWTGYEDGRGLAAPCQVLMSKTQIPPVTAYLTLCDNGWHFPLRREIGHELQQGADDQCDRVREMQTALLEQGQDTHNINCRICFDTHVGRMIMKSQKRTRLAHSWSFKRACKHYDRNNACPS